MLNLNEEITYYKDDHSFSDYLLAVRGHQSEHELPNEIQVYFVNNGVLVNISEKMGFDSLTEGHRMEISDLMHEEIAKWKEAMLSFRCDFDFNMLPGEEESAEDDEKEILQIFAEYTRKTKSKGFAILHNTQVGEVDGKIVPLSKHIHIVYTDIQGSKSLSEFIHTRIV